MQARADSLRHRRRPSERWRVTAWARRGVPPLGAALLVLVIAGAAGATTLTFASAVAYNTGTSPLITTPKSVAIGDLNHDGNSDLVTANQHLNSVSVLLGNGDGTLQVKVEYPAGALSGPASVAIGDLNQDGIPDLVTANQTSDSVSVLLGVGAAPGTFQTHVDYTTGSLSIPASVAIGDLNRDGHPDLAVADSNFDKAVVLLGNTSGNGTFQAHVDYNTSADPHSVAIGDLNHDGNPDLATANCCGSMQGVSVLLGNGDGTFRTRVNYVIGSGNSPWSVAIGDLNHDGNPDLATANSNSAKASVLLGNGDGTFQTHTDSTVGNTPLSVAIGDLDGDGTPDLVVANSIANTVSVLLQRSAPGAPTGVTATGGNGQASVSFTAPPTNGGGPISSYTVTASPGGATATGAASPLTVAGLSNGSAYTFTVTATNAVGTGSASAASNTTTPVAAASPTTPPAQPATAQPATVQPATVDTIAPTSPAGLTGRFTNGALILRWQPSTDSVAIDHYELYLGGMPVQRIAGSVTQVSVRIFNPAGTSLYTVRALDAAGNRSAVLAAVTVRPVGRPTSLPGRIPQWAWQLLAWQETGHGARPKTPAKLPPWYARWRVWRLEPFRLAS